MSRVQTVSITGYVYDDCCKTKYVVFDFGDGAMWRSPIANSFIVRVDMTHIYTRPGTYTITGLGVAEDACGNATGTESWVIPLAAPALTLVAVRVPGGPPYGVYLRTTDDIRLDYLSAATVEWDDGGPPAAAGWYADRGSYRTPVYTYAARGHRKIVVTRRYDGPQDTFSEVDSLRVEVGGAATDSSTWGRIKALYALGG